MKMAESKITNHFLVIQDQRSVLNENINEVLQKLSHVIADFDKKSLFIEDGCLNKLLYYEISLVNCLSEINLSFIEFNNKNPFPINNISEICSPNDSMKHQPLNNDRSVDEIKEYLKGIGSKHDQTNNGLDDIDDSTTINMPTNVVLHQDLLSSKSTAITDSESVSITSTDANINLEDSVAEQKPILKIMSKDIPSAIKNNLQTRTDFKNIKMGKNCNYENGEFQIKKQNLYVGSICTFSHIEHPGEFYVHVSNNEMPLPDNLNSGISKIFRGSNTPYTSKEEAWLAVGNFCFAYISKYKEWYRAYVLEWFKDDSYREVLVQLIDFGNKVEVSWKFLRKMIKEFANIPAYAIKCHLPLLYPPGSTLHHKEKHWPEPSIDAIVGLSGLFAKSTERILFKVVFVQYFGDSLGIDLYSVAYHDEISTVGQILIELKAAVEIVEDSNDLDIFLENIEDLESTENLNEAIVGYDAKDEARICQFTKPDGTCWKKNCTLEHRPHLEGGYTTDKHLVYLEAINSLEIPQIGEPVNMLITGYIDSCTFYGQIVRKPVAASKDYSLDQDLYNLLEEMNNKKLVNSYEHFKVWPAIGEIIIARHRTKKWARGVVIDTETDHNGQPQSSQVRFVDLGDCLELKLIDMRQMKKEFLHLPFQLIHIYLENASSCADMHDRKIQRYLSTEICYKNHLATFRSDSSPYSVILTKKNGQDIGELFIKENLAQKRISDITPAECML